MATIGALVYKIGADVSELVKNTNEISGHLTKMESMAGRVGTAFKGMFAGLGAAESLREIGVFLKESVDEFAAAEVSAARLGAAVRAQGLEVPVVRSRYLELAEALQETTVYEHEAAEGAETMLIQIGGVLPSQMERALKATADLAAGMGKDLPEAAGAVAKAFAGSTKELARMMPELKELQKDGLTAAEVMATIEKHFGGQAAAQVDTYSGSVKQLANQWKEVKEAIGAAIATDADVKSWIASTKESITNFAEEIKALGLKRALSLNMTGMGPVAGPEGMAWSMLQTLLGETKPTKGDIELVEDPKAKQARLDAAEAHKRAQIAAEQHAAAIKALQAEYVHFGEDANRVLAQAAQGMEYLDRISKEAAESIAKAMGNLRENQLSTGMTQPLDTRSQAEADAAKWREDQLADLKRAAAAGMPQDKQYEAEYAIEAEYQRRLRQAYDEWIETAQQAKMATQEMGGAMRTLAESMSPRSGQGGMVTPGVQAGLNTADMAIYNATLNEALFNKGASEDARNIAIRTRLAGVDLRGAGQSPVTINAQGAFLNSSSDLQRLADLVWQAMRRNSSLGGVKFQ